MNPPLTPLVRSCPSERADLSALAQALAWTLLGSAALAYLPAYAQNPPQPLHSAVASSGHQHQLGTVNHTIVDGDTLEQLSRRYLGDATLWPAVRAHNDNVHPLRLVPGQTLQLPLNLLRLASAHIDFVHGSASLSRSTPASTPTDPASTQQPLQPGQALQEGDTLTLPEDSYLTVRLADGSQVRIQAQSQVNVQQLRRRGRNGSLQTVLELEQGGLEVQVPGPASNTRQLEVVTPVASTSVRGTHFQVDTSAQRTSASVYSGAVQMQAVQGGSSSLPSAQRVQARHGMVLDQSQSNGGSGSDGTASTAARPQPLLAAVTLTDVGGEVGGAAGTPGQWHSSDAHWLELAFPALEQAAGYQLRIAEDRQGNAVLYQARLDTPQARLAQLPDGRYWVQVRGIDNQGLVGLDSQAPLTIKARPVAPLVQSPAPEAVVPLAQSQLHCTPVDEAQAYVLQVAALPPGHTPEQADFAQPLLQAQDSAQCQLDLASLPPGRYAWRSASVRWVQQQRDQGPYSPASAFSLAAPPAQPQEVQSQSYQGITRIHWQGGSGQRYRLQALASPHDAQPSLELWLDEPHWQVSGLTSGLWHIRIQAQDANGLHSAFSPTRQVQVVPLVLDSSGQPIGTDAGVGLQY